MATEEKNMHVNPEDSWPEAEKMLDNYFRNKKKSGIIFLLIFFFLGSAITIINYHFQQKESLAINQEKQIKSFRESTQNDNDITNTGIEIISENNKSSKDIDLKKDEIFKLSVNNIQSFNRIQNNNKSNEISDKSEIKSSKVLSKTYTAVKENISLQESPILNSVVTENQSSLSSSENITVENNAISLLKFSSVSIPFNTSTNDSLLKTKRRKPVKSTRLELNVYAGASLINDNLRGENMNNYLERRSNEESSVVFSHGGVAVSLGKGKWDLRAGIELSMLGQKINYSPISNSEYYETKGIWQHYQRTVVDSDSTFIFGILFINTQSKIVNDSLYTLKTDTLKGYHYDESVTRENKTNKFYYVEIPIEVSYTDFINRWGFGISVGFSPAMLISNNGYYLAADQSKIVPINKRTSSQLILIGRLNLEFSYLLTENIRLLIRPTGRMNLTKIEDETGTKHNYQSYGLNAGAIFKIR